MRLLNIVLSTVLLVSTSCSYFSRDAGQKKDLLATAGEKELYLQDLSSAIPPGLDSLEYQTFLKRLVRKWAEEQALLDKAELNLDEDQKDFESEIEKFRASLITYEYEQKFIRQKLDTVVLDSQVEEYYKEHPENFQLKDYVLKARFLKVDEKAPKLQKVKNWIISDAEEDIAELEDYCIQYAAAYLVENKWVQLSYLLDAVPIDVIDPKAFLTTTKYKEVYSPPFRYFLFIYDFRLLNTLSPLQLERTKITSAIINERRMNLLEQLRIGVLDEALNRNQVQIFVK